MRRAEVENEHNSEGGGKASSWVARVNQDPFTTLRPIGQVLFWLAVIWAAGELAYALGHWAGRTDV